MQSLLFLWITGMAGDPPKPPVFETSAWYLKTCFGDPLDGGSEALHTHTQLLDLHTHTLTRSIDTRQSPQMFDT